MLGTRTSALLLLINLLCALSTQAVAQEPAELEAFPLTPEPLSQRITGTLDWPPAGSPDAVREKRQETLSRKDESELDHTK